MSLQELQKFLQPGPHGPTMRASADRDENSAVVNSCIRAGSNSDQASSGPTVSSYAEIYRPLPCEELEDLGQLLIQ